MASKGFGLSKTDALESKRGRRLDGFGLPGNHLHENRPSLRLPIEPPKLETRTTKPQTCGVTAAFVAVISNGSPSPITPFF